MPPRFAYWTILIDNAPTAFRAREAAELLPTLNQLKRKNKDVVLKWFARGRLWESQQQERDDFERRKRAGRPAAPKGAPMRGRDWRPGGAHKDPRARFAKPDKKGPRRSSQASHDEKRGQRKLHERRREQPRRENVRNKAHKKAWGEAPRPDERRHQPERKEQQPPPRRPERPADTPEPPPSPEQIVIKPEPPERG